ncbi:N-acetyltransferase [bacterium]|nr:N-acetyltransferase [bacterium]
MIIRNEIESDIGTVYKINCSAFTTNAEANLVNSLRKNVKPIISLVAEIDDVLGHIMFSPVTLSNHPDLKMMGLAPMAVHHSNQKTGIGSKLIEEGLKVCKNLGFVAVAVLGHPKYYPKFGFLPSTNFAIQSTYEVPPEVFMILELEQNILKGKTGTIEYHSEFNQV